MPGVALQADCADGASGRTPPGTAALRGLVEEMSQTVDPAGAAEYFDGIELGTVLLSVAHMLWRLQPPLPEVATTVATYLKSPDFNHPETPYERRQAPAAPALSPRHPNRIIPDHRLTDSRVDGVGSAGSVGPRCTAQYGGVAVWTARVRHPAAAAAPRLPELAALLGAAAAERAAVFPAWVGVASGPRLVRLPLRGVHMGVAEQIEAWRSGCRRVSTRKVAVVVASAAEALARLQECGIRVDPTAAALRDMMECSTEGEIERAVLTDPGVSTLYQTSSSSSSHHNPRSSPLPLSPSSSASDDAADCHDSAGLQSLLGDLLHDLCSYGAPASDTEHAGPPSLTAVQDRCRAAAYATLAELSGALRNATLAALRVRGDAACRSPERDSVAHEIPLPSDGFTYDEWSVPDAARVLLLYFQDSGSGGGDEDGHTAVLTDVTERRGRGYASALAASPHLRSAAFVGPPLPPRRKPAAAAACAGVGGADGEDAGAAGSPSLPPPPPPPPRIPALRLDATRRRQRLRELHAAVYEPPPPPAEEEEEEGATYRATREEDVFVSHRGVRGPRLVRWLHADTGASHPNTVLHHHRQQARWVEYLTVAGIFCGRQEGREQDDVPSPPSPPPPPVFSMSAAFWLDLSHAVGTARVLRALRVERVRLTAAQVLALAAGVRACDTVDEVSLVDCGGCGEEWWTAAASLLDEGCRLRALRLSGNLVGRRSSLGATLRAAGRAGNLGVLELRGCGVGAGVLAAADVHACLASPALRCLDLSHNPLGEAGGMVVADALRGAAPPGAACVASLPARLRSVDLRGCSLGAAAAASVLAALQWLSPAGWDVDGCLLATRHVSQRAFA